jgi:ferritin
MDKPTTLKKGAYNGGLPDKAIEIINKHIHDEAYSSQIYLQMAYWCDVKGYTGAAKFFRKHAEEERAHMIKLYDYMADKNVIPTTPTIEAPKKEYADLYDVIESALQHEFDVTYSYEVDAQRLLEIPCHQTFQLFQWFIKEQVEEESLYQTIVDRYMILMKGGITGTGLLEFDEYLEELV